MALSGWQLAADLSDLKTVGVVDLPMLVDTYTTANRNLSGTTGAEIDAFTAPGGYGWDEAHSAWSTLRDELQDIYGHTAQALDGLARTVRHVVDVYCATDAGASKQLDDLWRNGPPNLSAAEYVPPAPAPVVLAHPDN